MSRSAERAALTRPRASDFPCVLPRAKAWVKFANDYGDRTLHSREMMFLFGFEPDSYVGGKNSNAALADLAGSALALAIPHAANFSMYDKLGDLMVSGRIRHQPSNPEHVDEADANREIAF